MSRMHLFHISTRLVHSLPLGLNFTVISFLITFPNTGSHLIFHWTLVSSKTVTIFNCLFVYFLFFPSYPYYNVSSMSSLFTKVSQHLLNELIDQCSKASTVCTRELFEKMEQERLLSLETVSKEFWVDNIQEEELLQDSLWALTCLKGICFIPYINFTDILPANC